MSGHTFMDAEQIGIMLAQAASAASSPDSHQPESYTYQRLEYQTGLQSPRAAMRYGLVRDHRQNKQI
jgi:hypothetical protein